jgi:hypothetical protein
MTFSSGVATERYESKLDGDTIMRSTAANVRDPAATALAIS